MILPERPKQHPPIPSLIQTSPGSGSRSHSSQSKGASARDLLQYASRDRGRPNHAVEFDVHRFARLIGTDAALTLDCAMMGDHLLLAQAERIIARIVKTTGMRH